MIEVRLDEGGESVIRPLDEAVGEALARSEVVVATRLGGGEWEIAPTTKVGVVSIGDVMVWIRPKVEIARLMFLIGYAHKAAWRDDTVSMSEVSDLVPALAHAFVDQ